MTTKLILGWCLVASILGVATEMLGQDIHFAHLAAVPMQTNPAYAGLMEARARAAIVYRGQWNNITNGFRTTSASADMKAYQNRYDVAGLGLTLTSDAAGDLSFRTQQLGINTSFLKALDNGKTYLAFGMQNVFNFQSIDWSQAQAFDFEPLDIYGADGRLSFWDIGGGLSFFQRPSRQLSWFGSIAGFHLNQPDVSFLSDSDGNLADRLYTKWSYHAGAEIKFGRFNSMRPSVLFLKQGPNRMLKLGTFYRFKADQGIATDSDIAVHFGAFARMFPARENAGVDAIIFAIRFDYELTVITVSFDTNVSSLSVISNGGGGPELSIIQQFDWGTKREKNHKVKCPTFQY